MAHGLAGLLVPFTPRDNDSHEPADWAAFAREIAARVDLLIRNPEYARTLGRAGRRRAVEQFSWPAIATSTVRLCRGLL